MHLKSSTVCVWGAAEGFQVPSKVYLGIRVHYGGGLLYRGLSDLSRMKQA